MFAYTFASPAVSLDGKEEGYQNIFNTVRGDDLVTLVPLGAGLGIHHNDSDIFCRRSFHKFIGVIFDKLINVFFHNSLKCHVNGGNHAVAVRRRFHRFGLLQILIQGRCLRARLTAVPRTTGRAGFSSWSLWPRLSRFPGISLGPPFTSWALREIGRAHV